MFNRNKETETSKNERIPTTNGRSRKYHTSELVKELATVKSRKQDIVIPRGRSIIVSCRATVGPVTKIPVLFELDPNHSWQNG